MTLLWFEFTEKMEKMLYTSAVADPGFPIGGGADPFGGCQPLTHTLFGKNICENERN